VVAEFMIVGSLMFGGERLEVTPRFGTTMVVNESPSIDDHNQWTLSPAILLLSSVSGSCYLNVLLDGDHHMPKITRTLGSGMTERSIVEFDWAAPGDVQAQIRAAIETFDRSSFQRLSQRLTELASGILDVAGLPSDPTGAYRVEADGTWNVLEAGMDPDAELDADCLPLHLAVMTCGVPPDSPESYAAHVLTLLQRAQEQSQVGSHDEALATSFAAGELVNEAAMKGVFERDFLAGEKVREGGRRAHQQTYGTEAEKEAQRRIYCEAYDAARASGANKTKAYELVARRFGVHPITIRRAVAPRDRQG
jgi:hypothetical protein